MKRKLKLLICIPLMILLSGCTKYELQKEVEAVVTNKEYKESYITSVPIVASNGKTTTTTIIPQYHPESYYVELKYKKLTKTIDSKELYESVETGDKVKVNLYKKKNKEKIRYER